MSSESLGILGGIVGSVVGLLGGVLGTYFSLRNVRGPRELAFVRKAAAAMWIFLLAFLAGLMLTPPDFRIWLWVPYVAVLPFAVRGWNRRQLAIRQAEAGGRA
jgi:hypothetical protein